MCRFKAPASGAMAIESAAPAQLNRTAAALSWRLWFKSAAILQRRQVLSVRVVMMPTEDEHIRMNFATVILSLCHKNCCIDGWGCCVNSAGRAARAPSVAAHSMSRCCSSPTAPESQNSHVRCCRGTGGLCNLPASMGRLCHPRLRRMTA